MATIKRSRKGYIPIGTKIRLIRDGIGAARDPEHLDRLTKERYGIGDTGVIVFPHPVASVAVLGWMYAEVDSKETPSEKRYIAVRLGLCEEIDDDGK
jgi:hypothetical protein